MTRTHIDTMGFLRRKRKKDKAPEIDEAGGRSLTEIDVPVPNLKDLPREDKKKEVQKNPKKGWRGFRKKSTVSETAPDEAAASESLDPSEEALSELGEKIEEGPPPLTIDGTIIDHYRVPANGDPESTPDMIVVDNQTFGKLIVVEPFLTTSDKSTLQLLRDNLRNSIPIEAIGRPTEVLEKYMWETAEKAGILEFVQRSNKKFMYYLMKDFVGFWEVDPLINDDNIEEISIACWNQPVRVWHRNHNEYMWMETNIKFESEAKLQAFIRRIAQFGGTTISLAQPSLEVMLGGASDKRATATLGDEITRPGSTLVIRKQKENPLSILNLAAPEQIKRVSSVPQAITAPMEYNEVHAHKTLTALMAAYLWLLLEKTTSILVAGETSSGKTVLMNAILALMNPKAKIVTAEDTPEINLPPEIHWQRMKTRTFKSGLSPSGQKYAYGLSDLLKIALRFSPTILSLGEMRGEESEVVASAITLGFSTITTLHAEDAESTVIRVTNPPMKFTEGHVRDVTAIVTMRKLFMPDGKIARRVYSIDEIKKVGKSDHEIVNVFSYDPVNDTFSPTTPEEVVAKSIRLKDIATAFGWNDEQVVASLKTRAAYLSDAVSHQKLSADDLARLVRKYTIQESRRELGHGGAD